MSSFLGAGLAWLETDETPAATATAAMSVTTAKPRSNPRIEPPLVATRHRVAAAGGAPGPGLSIGDDPPGKVKPALGQFASPYFVASALAALNVHPRTPRAARALAPRLARNLPQCRR